MKTPKVILWDFDGVILDSMPIREKGFIEVLKSFPSNQVKELIKFHNLNGGLSRYVKFRYFFEKILDRTLSETELMIWADRFSAIMKKLLIDPSLLINDSLNFIKKNYNNYRMHIVSGSDEQELNYICKKLDIYNYFISINGSPTPKNKLVSNLLKTHNYYDKNVILIGDSFNDYEAANINNITFYGFNNKSLRQYNYIESFKTFNF